MDTKKLRQKILDLAIHGKLVPQDPNDEPASVLLERIKAEKERLIKEGKIKRSRKTKTTTDTPHYENVPFEVPEGWVWCRLEDYVKSVSDGDHTAPPQSSNGIPFLVISDITDGHLKFLNKRFVSRDYYQNIPIERKPEKGDLLFSVTGSYGIVVLVNSNKEFCFQRHIGLIKPFIYNNYLYFLLCSDYIKQLCDSKSTGTAQKTIGLESLRNFLIPIPPYEEQIRIGKELKNILSLIVSLDQNSVNLKTTIKQLKCKILDLAIHGKLVSQDFNDEPASELLKRINPKAEIACDNGQYVKIPRNWALVKMGDIFTIVSAKRVLKSEWRTNGIPFYRAREIARLSEYNEVNNELFIDPEHYNELKNKYGVPTPGDIMLSAVGTIGKSYIVKDSDKFYYKDASVLCLRNVNRLNSKYFSMLFSSSLLINQMKENSKGTTVDTITLEKIKSYIIPFPPLSEQERIVQNVEKLFMILNTISNSLEA